MCRHCRAKRACRPRGLCWTCYYTPGVKGRYPSVSKYARRGVGHAGARAASGPTAARPGTSEKVAELCLRSARGEGLWHPRDAGFPE